MQKSSDYVHCMLIPMSQYYLLLPNTTIAEVIPMPKLAENVTADSTILGFYHWRDNILPVIDLDVLMTDALPKGNAPRPAHKLCIINGIHIEAQIQLYAAPCHGVPQLITLNASALQASEETEENPWIYSQLKIGHKTAFIPNLDAIEKHIKNQLHTP